MKGVAPMSNLLFLSAEIVSDRMILMKKDAPREPLQTFPLGHFAVEFLNRIGEKSLTDQMQCAFPPDGEDYDLLKSWDLDETEYVGFGKRLLSVLDLMKRFPPYSMYDQTETRTEIEQLFTAENYTLISEWHRKLPRSEKTRIKETILLDFTSLIRDLPYCKGKALFEQTIDIAVDFMSLLLDFEELDLLLQRFTDAVSAMKGADTDLLALLAALNCSDSFSEVETKYKVQSQEDFTYKVVRVLTFSDYVSFLLTDFYEGIMHNHYPRRCPSCGRVFLMENARYQKYCKGYAPPELTGGQKLLCSQWALRKQSGLKKEFAEADDANRRYTNVCGSIRKYQSLGFVTVQQAEEAKDMAMEFYDRAISDRRYAQGDYLEDIQLASLLRRVGYVPRRKR